MKGLPEHDDAVAAWLARRRDEYKDVDGYLAVDWLLDDYKAHADTDLPLGQEIPERNEP